MCQMGIVTGERYVFYFGICGGTLNKQTSGHNLPDKSCVADTAMQIELA